MNKKSIEKPLDERVDIHFRSLSIALLDVEGMMRHIMDSLGALKYRYEEDQRLCSPELMAVFSNSVKMILDHLTGFEPIDSESAINQLLVSFPDQNKLRDGRGWLPLHWAAAVHNTEEAHMKHLLAERPFAAYKGHLPIIETAAPDTGNEPGPQSYHGLLPLHLICSLKFPETKNALRVMNAYPEAVQQPDPRQWLPIHWCAYNCRNSDVMKLLIERYHDGIYQVTKKGKLPFQLSCRNRYTDMLDILISENPESVMGLDYNGNSPMHDAAKCFNAEAARKLFKLKSDIARIRNFREQLPIHRAFCYIAPEQSRMHYRQCETIKVLFYKNPETASLPDADDALPLHLAVYFNSTLEVVEAVYSVFPSASLIQDGAGKIPIDYANTAEVKRLLLKSSKPLRNAGLGGSFARFTG